MAEVRNQRVRIALQKSGRLNQESMDLLRRCGIHLHGKSDKLYYHSDNFPLDVLMIRDDDIPALVAQGTCDLGIVGSNVLEEARYAAKLDTQPFAVQEQQSLAFGQCRLSIAVPEKMHYQSLADLQNLRIATSYPATLQHHLKAKGIQAHITLLTGSVEIAPALNLADCICDLVSTGATLESNGLKEVEILHHSKALLIRSMKKLTPEQLAIIERLLERLNGVMSANEAKYIMLHAPKAALESIVEMIPGAESPTILPLAGSTDKVVVHAVCRETVFWETLEQLKSRGASSILVLPIEKMLT